MTTGNYIVLVRMQRGHVLGLKERYDDDALTQFQTESEARDCADDHPLCKAFGYQVVELDI